MAREGTSDSVKGAAIAIIAAAIGALGSLGGSYLANDNARQQLSLQIAHETAVRQVDLRRDAYKRFIVVANEYQSDLQDILPAIKEKRFPKLAREIDNDSVRIHTAYSEIQLVGSEEAARQAQPVLLGLDKAGRPPGRASEGSLRSEVEATNVVLQRFIDTVREEMNRQ